MANTTLKVTSEQNPFDEKWTDRKKKTQILKISSFFSSFSAHCLKDLSKATLLCEMIHKYWCMQQQVETFNILWSYPFSTMSERHAPRRSDHSNGIRLFQGQVWKIDGRYSYTNTPVTSEPVARADSGSCTHNMPWLILHIYLSLLLIKAINPNYGRRSSSSCCHISQQH